MNLGRFIVTWTARHLLGLLLIVLVLVAIRVALPPASAWLREQVSGARTAPVQQQTFSKALAAYQGYAELRELEAKKEADELRSTPETLLKSRRADIPQAISQQEQAKLTRGQLALAGARGDAQRILRHYRAQTEIRLLQRELQLIEAILAERVTGRDRTNLAIRRAQAVQQLRLSAVNWTAGREQVREINQRPFAPARNYLCRNAPMGIGCENYRLLTSAKARMEAAAARHAAARRQIAVIDQATQSLRIAEKVTGDASAVFEAQAEELHEEVKRANDKVGANWVVWVTRPMLEVLPTALAILLTTILSPILIKAAFYFLVAPLAARRSPLRLLSNDGGRARSTGSKPSQEVVIEPGHELLLVPEAVQSTPEGAEKHTKWLLSWSMPLSSFASGMVALVQLRVHQRERVLVSATGSGLAEIALVDLPFGSAMVLRPRALRGVVQPRGRPMKISRHWRIRHLSAWLTLQFRYLMFHGPCILIIEGTRGVRLEPAEDGRAINQAATLGFTAGLAYSVSRSEAFGAYLLGKQELFNDNFADGPGCYLYEEMPRINQRGGLMGRGLRGIGDAALKIFGL